MTRRRLLAALFLLLPLGLLAHAEAGGRGHWRGSKRAIAPMAKRVAHRAELGLDATAFHTGSDRFDGEWALGTCLMTVAGVVQVLEQHPELRAELKPGADACVDQLLSAEMRQFGTRPWGFDGLEAATNPDLPDAGHAYLGYVNFALGMYARIDGRHAEVHRRLTDSLARKLTADLTLETYPSETYPPDIAVCISSIGLADPDHPALPGLIEGLRGFVDPETGLLYQSVSNDGYPVDQPRSSGTAFAAYFLGYADPQLSRELSDAVAAQHRTVMGLGLVREYPPGVKGRGDIDSGPVLFGISPSATGFAAAGARMHGDRARYKQIYRTARLVGVPFTWGGERRYLVGDLVVGDLSDAIMLAMFTAPPLEVADSGARRALGLRSSTTAATAVSEPVVPRWTPNAPR